MAASETENETRVTESSSEFPASEIETSNRLLESAATDTSTKSNALAPGDSRQSNGNSTLPELTVGNPGSSGADKSEGEHKQSDSAAAGKIFSGEISNKDQIQRMCKDNISGLVSNLNPDSGQIGLKQSAIVTSLANAEKVGGQALVHNVLDAANSNLWLDGSKNRLKQNPIDPANPHERRLEVYNHATNKTVHSMNFSVLPEPGRSGEEKQNSTNNDQKDAKKVSKAQPSWRRSYR